MNQNSKLVWPMILGIIGALYWIVVAYGIAYLATGGMIGTATYEFGGAWVWISVIAMLSAVVGIVGASIVMHSPKVAGGMMIGSVVGYIVVSLIINQPLAVPYLLFGSIGVTFLFISGLLCLISPTVFKSSYSSTRPTPQMPYERSETVTISHHG